MEFGEETLSSRTIHTGGIITLEQKRVRLPNGVETIRDVVVHRGAVAMIPVQGESIVCVRQYRIGAGRTTLEIPAGTLEEGETPHETAHRELKEEIGLRAKKLTPLFEGYISPGYCTEKMHFFLAEHLEPAKEESDRDELIEIVPVPLSEIWQRVLRGEILDNKTIIAALWVEHFLNRTS